MGFFENLADFTGYVINPGAYVANKLVRNKKKGKAVASGVKKGFTTPFKEGKKAVDKLRGKKKKKP